MTQTSVEWLIEQFKDYDHTPASNNKEYVIIIPQWIFNAKRDEALEREKQQIADAFEEGYNRAVKVIEDETQRVIKNNI
jgi:hypothetical protein